MNVYDFDKTIYAGDSTIDFYLYCIKRKPAILLCFPGQLWGAVRYKMGWLDKTRFKEIFYRFLSHIDDISPFVSGFWDKNQHKIKKWYLDQQMENDVVISASPFFLLDEICTRTGIRNLIASDVDKRTGKYTGTNCYGEEKVRRFQKEIGGEIEAFYTDSLSDLPMMQLAQKAYLVDGNTLMKWNGEKDEKVKGI